VELF